MSIKEYLTMDEASIKSKVTDLKRSMVEKRLNLKAEDKDTSFYKKTRKEIARLLTACHQLRSKS